MMEEGILALKIGLSIIDKMPKQNSLRGNYKKYFEEYKKFIDEDILYCKQNKIDDLEDLENELLHVECVFNWLQEKKIKLKEMK